ncbi:MAG TPA: sigma factor-like helix-turn-helix DNA-binding protein [Bryobacteraceae bacterium]|nr:sigma factor-like helix-turn-helix DNA-binding protein [Bryobacteraceae bacterium]
MELIPSGEWIGDILSMDEISPACRTVLVMHFQEELTLQEVAAILAIPLGTVTGWPQSIRNSNQLRSVRCRRWFHRFQAPNNREVEVLLITNLQFMVFTVLLCTLGVCIFVSRMTRKVPQAIELSSKP